MASLQNLVKCAKKKILSNGEINKRMEISSITHMDKKIKPVITSSNPPPLNKQLQDFGETKNVVDVENESLFESQEGSESHIRVKYITIASIDIKNGDGSSMNSLDDAFGLLMAKSSECHDINERHLARCVKSVEHVSR